MTGVFNSEEEIAEALLSNEEVIADYEEHTFCDVLEEIMEYDSEEFIDKLLKVVCLGHHKKQYVADLQDFLLKEVASYAKDIKEEI